MSEHEIVRDGKILRVTLREMLTAADVPGLQSGLKKEIDSGASDLVVDMAKTVSLDSMGIGLLIAANNKLSQVNGAISLINVSPDILKLLRSMRLVERLHAAPAVKGGA